MWLISLTRSISKYLTAGRRIGPYAAQPSRSPAIGIIGVPDQELPLPRLHTRGVLHRTYGAQSSGSPIQGYYDPTWRLQEEILLGPYVEGSPTAWFLCPTQSVKHGPLHPGSRYLRYPLDSNFLICNVSPSRGSVWIPRDSFLQDWIRREDALPLTSDPIVVLKPDIISQ